MVENGWSSRLPCAAAVGLKVRGAVMNGGRQRIATGRRCCMHKLEAGNGKSSSLGGPGYAVVRPPDGSRCGRQLPCGAVMRFAKGSGTPAREELNRRLGESKE